jgi:CRISPR type III-A-associated protein Csm2
MSNYFYEDAEKEVLKELLLTDRAKKWADSFIRPGVPKERWQRNPKLTSAQLRRFHNEAKELEERVKNTDNFLKIRPLVKMMKSKVANACPTTGERKVPEEFRKYIEEMIDNINDAKDFKAFALCFESVVGFFYGQGGR